MLTSWAKGHGGGEDPQVRPHPAPRFGVYCASMMRSGAVWSGRVHLYRDHFRNPLDKKLKYLVGTASRLRSETSGRWCKIERDLFSLLWQSR
jgi:hypothetical protein